MKRCKVILRYDPLAPKNGQKAMSGFLASIVDADTGEPLDCAQDFKLNVPLSDDAITVDVRLLVHEIEVK